MKKALPRKPQYTVPESTNTVILKTVMELKESFGRMRQDLDHLNVEVISIKKRQQITERISKILTIVLPVVITIWIVVLYAVVN